MMSTRTETHQPAHAPKSQRAAMPLRQSPGGMHDARTSMQRAIGNHAMGGLPRMPDAGADAGRSRIAGTGDAENRTGMPARLMRGLEALSGLDLSDVRVHRNSPRPARVDALAYTQGTDIHLAPGEESHLPHEAWHVVQQMQGRVRDTGLRMNGMAINDDPHLESEADTMGARALHGPPSPMREALRRPGPTGASLPAQRQVRINGGATRVTEARYRLGGTGASIGTRFSVASLLDDSVHRVFASEAELEGYANGQTDYIGDVVTASAGTYWYRLPEHGFIVLGESHSNPMGNVEDVILGLRTSRFMHEAYNELTPTAALNIPFAGTQTRMDAAHRTRRSAPRVDRTNFNPTLENIIIKALTGAAIFRNEYLPANPSTMSAADQQYWGRRASTGSYSYGERTALYLSIGIHIANDISRHDFGTPNSVESNYIFSGRQLKDFYLANQVVLDQFMTAKDADDLIGIFELTSPNNFANLNILRDFSLVLHEYGARYIEQLGTESGNATLQAQGQALSANTTGGVNALNPAREEIMWQRILHARSKGYLLVGMGDAHHINLTPKLNAAGIAHEEVAASLGRQKTEIDSRWTP